MTTTDTPESDAAWDYAWDEGGCHEGYLLDTMQKLERERDEARKAAEDWRSTAGDVAAMPITEHPFSWENGLVLHLKFKPQDSDKMKPNDTPKSNAAWTRYIETGNEEDLERACQNLERENAKLRILVSAIKSETYGGIYAEDVDEGNWFDARKIILEDA